MGDRFDCFAECPACGEKELANVVSSFVVFGDRRGGLASFKCGHSVKVSAVTGEKSVGETAWRKAGLSREEWLKQNG